MTNNAKVYVMYENEEWYKPLQTALNKIGVPNEAWNIAAGQLKLDETPPPGIFYSKMSASSYTRGHWASKYYIAAALEWLSHHNRRVVNGKRALALEISKAAQHLALQAQGLSCPNTIVCSGKAEAIQASEHFDTQGFIVKPNQGGKGLGVNHFASTEEFVAFLDIQPIEELTIDGILLIQTYIPPKDQRIVRMEFINGQFYYAVEVQTGGGFELCPADACEVDPSRPGRTTPTFTILEDFWIPEIAQCEAFLAANQIEVAGIEFLENEQGQRFFYDVNTNTNYNSEAEAKSIKGYNGLAEVAQFLRTAWEKEQMGTQAS